MNPETRTMQIRIYEFNRPTLLGPDDEWRLYMALQKQPGRVVAIYPLQQVDPRNVFAFVSNGHDTFSVCRKNLKRIATETITWIRQPLMTHNQKVAAQVRAMNEYFLKYKSFFLEKDNSTTD